MHIEQLYTNCLAEAAYFIESDGEVAIVDPIRDTDIYISKAAERNAKIKYIFETHFHADFISGHLELAAKTGATIVFGPLADTKFAKHTANDGEIFKLGEVQIKVLHTPGHTPESSCFLLIDEKGKDYALFTGDTLFVGDVGRPDLLDGKMSKEELASMLYDSLNNKILPLNDDVLIYPAHGPGSACGKNIGKETWSTLGVQRMTNYALQPQTRENFIKSVTEGLSAAPAYFFSDARINKEGYNSLDQVLNASMVALSASEFKQKIDAGCLVLDTRSPDDFEKGYIDGAVNIGLNGTYAVWVGALIDINKPLVILCDEGKEHESIVRLARVGYENVRGFLNGGIKGWSDAGYPVAQIASIDPTDFNKYIHRGFHILDVRKPGELQAGYVKNAVNVPLNNMNGIETKLKKNDKIMVHCAGGYRSMIAVSLLKNAGYTDLVNVRGGFAKIRENGADIDMN